MGSLTQTPSVSSATVNLTTVGLIDWSYFQNSSSPYPASDYKNGGGNTIPSPTTLISVTGVGNYGNDPRTISWTDGTINSTDSFTGGIYTPTSGGIVGNGFQLVFPADTNIRTTYVYLGGYNITTAIKIIASLSDGSAATQTDSTTLIGVSNASMDGVVQLVYQANSPSQSLTFQWSIQGSSTNVTLQAVAYASSVVPAPSQATYPLSTGEEYF